MSDNIALQTKVDLPQAAQAGAGGLGGQSPAQTMDTYAQVQQRMQAGMQAQTAFQARQRAGAIIAAAPNFEAGLTAAQADPLVAGNAPDVLQSLRATRQTIVQTQGEQAKQNQDAVQAVLRSAAGAAKDPTQLPKLLAASMQTLPPDIADRVKPAVTSFYTGLLDGLPSDPQARSAAYTQRLTGLLSSAGMSPETVEMNVGKPIQVDTGAGIAFGQQTPGQAPTFQGYTPKGLAPQLTNLPDPAHPGATIPALVGGTPSAPQAGAVGLGVPQGAMPGVGGSPPPGPQAVPTATTGAVAPSPSDGNPSPALDTSLSLPPAAQGAAPPSGTKFAGTAPPGPNAPVGPGGINSGYLTPPVGNRSLTPEERSYQDNVGKLQADLQTATQLKYAGNAADAAGKMNEEFNDDATAAPVMLKRLDNMSTALQAFQAGPGSDLRVAAAQMAKAAQNFGVKIDDQTIEKLAGGQLDAAQFFNANIRTAMVANLKSVAQGTGRVMKSEVDAFMEAISRNTDPKAIMDFVNQARYGVQVGLDRANYWHEYRNNVLTKSPSVGTYGLEDYGAWYANNRKLGDLPATLPSGLQVGPTSRSAVMDGAAQGQGTPTRPSAPAQAGPPAGIPPGSQYSPSRRQYRDPAGKLYDQSGKPL